MKPVRNLFPLCGLLLMSTPLWAGGGLDTTFDSDGKKRIDFKGQDDFTRAVLQQGDGKLVITGNTHLDSTPGDNDLLVVRLNDDGKFDTSFDSDGMKKIDIGGDDYAYAAAQQADGKLVLAGYTQNNTSGARDFLVIRLNSNGTFDTTFAGSGKKKIDFGGNVDTAMAIQVQADGKLLVAGYTCTQVSTTCTKDLAIVRLNSNGSLDTGFDGDGKKKIDFNGGDDYGRAVLSLPSGAIVIAGYSQNTSSFVADMIIAQLGSDGSMDGSFGSGGKKRIDFNGNNDYGQALAQQADGKIILAGYTFDSTLGYNDMAFVRLNANGSLDTSFDGDGRKRVNFGRSASATGVALQSDGKIVASGYAQDATLSGNDMALARLNTDGSPDTTFNTSGKKQVDFGGNNEYGIAVAAQTDDKPLVAGTLLDNTTNLADIVVIRVKP